MKRFSKRLFVIICLLAFLTCDFSYIPAQNNMEDYKYSTLSDEYYYYRNILSEKERTVYDELYDGLCNASNAIRVTESIDYDEILIIVKAVMYDHPEIVWCNQTYSVGTIKGTNMVVYVYPDYNDLVDHRIDALAQIDEELSPLFDVLNTLDSDIEIVKYVHDYFIHTVEYSLDSDYNQSMYSAVIEKKSVCAGYSHAIQYILCKMGISCTFIVGESRDEYHAWNLLMLDGEYYALDTTWDDPIWIDEDGNVVSDYEYYTYTYFNVTDVELGEDHERDEISQRLPVAEGTKYSFANYYGNADSARGSDFSKIETVVPEETSGLTDTTEIISNDETDDTDIETNETIETSSEQVSMEVSTNEQEISDVQTTENEENNTNDQTMGTDENSSSPKTIKEETDTNTSVTKVKKPAKVRIKKLRLKKRRLIIRWTKGKKGVTGYQVQFSRSKKFKKRRTYTIKKRKKTKIKSKRLKRGKKYFVRVRAYRLSNNKRIYSDWSKVKKKRIK